MTTVAARISACRQRDLLAAAVTLLTGLGSAPLFGANQAPSLRDLKKLDVEDLMNIEVTSVARRPEKLLGAASAIQVITAADIRRSGATTLPEALRLAGNLHVAQRSAHGWAISARGFNTDLANKLLVMIDGRTVYTPLFSGVYWEAQDYALEDIDRIEVISGPGGTLWGANAVNGVINIITKNAAETGGLLAQAGGGTETDRFAAARYGGSLSPDIHFRVYGKHLDQENSALADGSSASDQWRKTQGGFHIDATPSAEISQTLQGDVYKLREGAPVGDTTTMRGANMLGRWTRRISDDSDWAVQAYYDWTQLSDAVPALVLNGIQFAPAGTLHDDLRTFDVDFQHRLSLGSKHSVVWGAGLRHTRDVVDNIPGLAFLPARLEQNLYSAFFQDEMLLHDDFSFTLGAKFEHNDYTGAEVEPNLRFQWQPDATRTVWGAVSRAVRTPSRIDRDLRQAAPPNLALLYGNPDFRSEKLVAYELGYRAQQTASLSTSLATFYNAYDDVRSTSITPATILPFFFSNNVAGHTYGFEFSANLRVTDHWDLHASYNLLEERLHVKAGEFDLSSARNETSDPQQQASLRSSVNLPGGFEFDTAVRWVDTLQNNDGQTPGTVSAYLELNLRVAWHFGEQLEFSIAGQNLLHKQHPEYGFQGPARAEAERSAFGKLVWQP